MLILKVVLAFKKSWIYTRMRSYAQRQKMLHQRKITIDNVKKRMKRGIKTVIAAQKNPRQYYDVTVSSFGGCGTSMLLNFLSQILISNHPDNLDGIKHIGFPPDCISKRCIYIFGDPRACILSLFRRLRLVKAHHLGMRIGLQKFPPHWFSPSTLENYAKKGKDSFLLAQQFDSWFNSQARVPVLFIRYETLWDNLEILFDFVGLPTEARNNFPKYQQRKSDINTVPAEILDRLDQIHRPLKEKLDALPDYILREPDEPADAATSDHSPRSVQKSFDLHT